MENQVTSIEQSQRLLELGVPAGKASMVWCQKVLSFADGIDYEAAQKAGAELVPAFTVADLLGMLPTEINGHLMVIRTYGKFWFEIRYEHIEIIEGQKCAAALLNKTGSTLLNAVYNMLESYAESKKQETNK